MDWKYILTLTPEDLTEQDVEDLYSTLAWYDFENEVLEDEKCMAVIKLSQEIMKFKAEQVQVLLTELDGLARKQAEDEAKSSKMGSKSPISFEYNDLEQKYVDLKMKYKQQSKVCEKFKRSLEESKIKMADVEQERDHLQLELQRALQDGSQSDVSESLKEEHKQLVAMLHNKNKHISNLLKELEEAESENNVLKEKLAQVRDELADAAKQLASLTGEVKACKVKLKDASAALEESKQENAALKSQIADLAEEKQSYDRQIEEFTAEINVKVDEWKRVLDEKNREIQKLQAQQKAAPSSSASLEELPPAANLNEILCEKDAQIENLRRQLQDATKEMEETTSTLKRIAEEREKHEKAGAQLNGFNKDLKKQLKSAHERCKDLQDEVGFLEKGFAEKHSELQEIIAGLREDESKLELSKLLMERSNLKSECLAKEKKIVALVRASNKLQEAFDSVCLENQAMRDKLGIEEDEPVNVGGVLLKYKKQKKALQKLQLQHSRMEEEYVSAKLKLKEICKQNDENVSTTQTEELKGLYEENEALRKGLHEVLESIQKRSESSGKEIHSETLEKLLRALDVKHISGWYHPAMRLQAELHTIQGINSELREQLRLNKAELMKHKQKSEEPQALPESIRTIEEANVEPPKEEPDGFAKLQEELEATKEEIATLKQNLATLEEQKKTLEETAAVSEAKLQEYLTQSNLSGDELAKTQHNIQLAASVALMNRKCLYYEKQESIYREELCNFKNDLLTAESNLKDKSAEMSVKITTLQTKLMAAENELKGKVDGLAFQRLQKSSDELKVKYSKLLQDFENICSENSLELKILNETTQSLKKEKQELKEKLSIALTKTCTADDAVAKKLAETEVNEITERQRANHVNNLYELVKEQLQKSEERFKEFEAYNKEIMHRNLILQENFKDMQDRVLTYVDLETFKQVQSKCSALIEQNGNVTQENETLKESVKALKAKLETHQMWSASQEYELLSLKHQIVDLQAAGDDKTVIARLSTDVVNARLAENRLEQKINNVSEIVKELEKKCEKNESLLEGEKERKLQMAAEFEKRFSVLQETIRKQREQYFGCVPLSIKEKFASKLKQAVLDRKQAFRVLCKAQKFQNECAIVKEELETQFVDDQNVTTSTKWQEEKKGIKLECLKYRRLLEFKENQIRQLHERLNADDEQIVKLEEELLQLYDKSDDLERPQLPEALSSKPVTTSQQTQTLEISKEESKDKLDQLQLKILEREDEMAQKNDTIDQQKSKIIELEKKINAAEQQIADKQSQIIFYEQHIRDLQGKIEKAQEEVPEKSTRDSNVMVQMNEETLTLKATLNNLQATLKEKDDRILNYQTLLKRDRDEHSLAAARMQEELKILQNALIEQQKAFAKAEETTKEPHPNRAAIEQYILQVHQLEKHTADLHTTVTSLNSQLQASRQESVRWRALANDRLEKMEELRKDLEMQHQNEIEIYKKDSEKWREEVSELKQLICKFRSESSQVAPDLNKVLKDKDDKIHEMSVLLRQAKGEAKRHIEKDENNLAQKLSELSAAKEQLLKENELLKSRHEQLLNKEKSARDEIRELKYQLARRPNVTTRTDKTDKTIKEQLQKKVTSLENEILDLKEHLARQIAINENHKTKMHEDFEKWKKQKHWQQMAEKLKTKLKEKEDSHEKLQQVCSGYRILIERLEKEKHTLEAKLRSLRTNNPFSLHSQIEGLRNENIKLQSEVEVLHTRLEMNQHHSGGLGAAMLQEKLESQERKIAVLELAAKSPAEVRAELERLQTAVSNLQKRNLCLEAANLELKLDLEKSTADVPHMREQIQHLESYVEVLKTENAGLKLAENPERTEAGTSADVKKVAELEKTVFVLKRVVEKLQAENKRLLSGRLCTLNDCSTSSDQLRRDLHRTKQQYGASVQKAARLEQELTQANNKIKTLESKSTFKADPDELRELRIQLENKTVLLDKVKLLLQKAAAREKALVEEVEEMKRKFSAGEQDD